MMITEKKQASRSTSSYTGAVSFTLSNAKELKDIFVNINALPLTSETLTITLTSGAGDSYVIYTIDPSVATGTQWDLWLSQELSLADGDTITVAYANSDANTVKVLVHYTEQ